MFITNPTKFVPARAREGARPATSSEEDSCNAAVPPPVFIASVAEVPKIKSDVTSNIPIAISAISDNISEIVGTYGNSNGNFSDGSASNIKEDIIMPSDTTIKGSNRVTKPVCVVTSNISSNATKEDLTTSYPCGSSNNHYIECDSAAAVTNTQLVSKSEVVKHKDKNSCENIIIARTEDSAKDSSKPRTALFKEGEDDESMAAEVNIPGGDLSANNSKFHSFIKFGSFLSDIRQNMTKEEEISCTAMMPAKLIFYGVNLHKRYGKQFVQIGSMHGL